MSREGYTVPTGAALVAKPTSAFNPDFREDNIQMKYLCGDCGSSTHLKKADPIRCKDCGCRVLYKERTKRMIQFEAR